MADSSTTANPRRFRNENVKNKNEISRNEIQSAIDKSVELRALHAALMQDKTPVFRFSARNYPVFTPSYEDESLCSNNWDCYEPEEEKDEKSHHMKENSSSNKGLANPDSHICPVHDQISVNGSSTNPVTVLETSPKTDFSKSSRRTSLAHLRSESTSCNKCKPATIIKERGERGVPSIDLDSSLHKNRGKNLSRLFPQFNKKNKNEKDPSSRPESEKQTQTFNDINKTSIDTLQKELMEANAIRDKALIQVLEMRSSLGELKQKLEFLETYCEDLKKALQKAAMEKDSETNQKHLMPVTEEVMVEGFLQIVSEARSSVRQFCKLLIGQFEEGDAALTMLLQPHKQLSVNSRYSRNTLYHLEGIINQQFYQNFENCVFKKNGSQKSLDPRQDREKQFSAYVGLRNLSWNEVLRKGAKCYSEEFSKFCDEKMSCVISALKWTRPWPEQLLQAFFVSAKCVWLLHSLAFSFDPPIGILRVDEDRGFDSVYMEDLLMDKQRSQGSSRVKVMVMPGFYVQDKVLRCKVLCKYKSVIN